MRVSAYARTHPLTHMHARKHAHACTCTCTHAKARFNFMFIDLNRIKKKPYVPKPEEPAAGAVIDERKMAAEAWRGHRLRNDSVVVDLLQGQLKSTLVINACIHMAKHILAYYLSSLS